jgi:hypothetical protein
MNATRSTIDTEAANSPSVAFTAVLVRCAASIVANSRNMGFRQTWIQDVDICHGTISEPDGPVFAMEQILSSLQILLFCEPRNSETRHAVDSRSCESSANGFSEPRLNQHGSDGGTRDWL